VEQRSVARRNNAPWMADALRQINEMPSGLFERLVMLLLAAAGYTNVSIIHTGQRETITGLAVRSGLENSPLFFQFTRCTSNVGVRALREFTEGTIAHQAHGMLVTTASFTRAARSLPDGSTTNSISLIDGTAFCEMLLKHDVGVHSKLLRIDEIELDPVFFKQSHILEVLTTPTLRRRTIEIFPMGYLTIIAIIQGVALDIVLTAAVHYMIARHSDVPVYLCQGITGLFCIIVVSYEYLWFTTIMRWTPTFFDTLMPYVLGAAEIVPPLVITKFDLWWLSTIALMFFGGCAFCYTVFRSSQAMFDRENVHAGLRKLLGTLISLCFATSLYGGIVYAIWVEPDTSTLARVLQALSVSVVAGFIVALSEKGLAAFYRQYDLPRR
jgi:Restriction endonuclease